MRTHPRFYIYTNTIFAVLSHRLSFFVWPSDIYCFHKYNNHLICFVEHWYITHMTFSIWIDIVHLNCMNNGQETRNRNTNYHHSTNSENKIDIMKKQKSIVHAIFILLKLQNAPLIAPIPLKRTNLIKFTSTDILELFPCIQMNYTAKLKNSIAQCPLSCGRHKFYDAFWCFTTVNMFALHISLSQTKIYFKYQHIAIFNTQKAQRIMIRFSCYIRKILNFSSTMETMIDIIKIVFGRVRDYI